MKYWGVTVALKLEIRLSLPYLSLRLGYGTVTFSSLDSREIYYYLLEALSAFLDHASKWRKYRSYI